MPRNTLRFLSCTALGTGSTSASALASTSGSTRSPAFLAAALSCLAAALAVLASLTSLALRPW
jgi:hypothetical protein